MEPKQLEILSGSEEDFFTSDPMQRYEHNQARVAAVEEIKQLRSQLEKLHKSLRSTRGQSNSANDDSANCSAEGA